MVPCSVCFVCVSISTNVRELEGYTGKPRMYDETHKIQSALITKCGLYVHGSLFTFSISVSISTDVSRNQRYTHKPRIYDQIYDETHSWFLVHFTVFGCQSQQTYKN